jgi:hypothetical protein
MVCDCDKLKAEKKDNHQLINDMKFDSLVAALNYRMNNLERDVAWVDNVEVK